MSDGWEIPEEELVWRHARCGCRFSLTRIGRLSAEGQLAVTRSVNGDCCTREHAERAAAFVRSVEMVGSDVLDDLVSMVEGGRA